MKITQDIKPIIMARAAKDKEFLDAMLTEAVSEIRSGNVEVGKAMLRDYLNSSPDVAKRNPGG